jgi:prepilin-type N-terminal cleavage/methylation domain-containing protein
MIKKRFSAGFTLIELLVVIAIIGVLSALLLSNFVGIRERGADSALKNNATQLKTALRLYYNDFQKYPTGDGVLNGCGTGTVAAPPSEECAAGTVFMANGTTFMKTLPSEFEYYSDGGQTFLIVVTLANASDADIEASQTRCNPAGRTGYYSGTPTEFDYFVCED